MFFFVKITKNLLPLLNKPLKINNMKGLFKALVLSLAISFIACKKEGKQGPQGPQGPQGEAGPKAEMYEFSLVFGSSTKTATYKHYKSLYKKVVLIYIDIDFKDWIMMPYVHNSPGYVPVNYNAVVDELANEIRVYTDRGDNLAGSPWASSVVKDFRIVVFDASNFTKKDSLNCLDFSFLEKNYKLVQ